MHLHNCRSSQEHLRMLLQSLRALCLAPGGSGSVWKHVEAMVRSPGVSGRIACGFGTKLHFADVTDQNMFLLQWLAFMMSNIDKIINYVI